MKRSANTYSYKLYSFDRDGLGGSIKLMVGPDSIVVDDCTYGPDVKTFFGRYEHDYTVSIDREGAETILNSLGILPGMYPTETLALRFAERHTGNSTAASEFKRLALSAGVKPDVFDW